MLKHFWSPPLLLHRKTLSLMSVPSPTTMTVTMEMVPARNVGVATAAEIAVAIETMMETKT